MPQTVNQRRKEILESCDFHLFTAIDRAFAIWKDTTRQHPELSEHLVRLMERAERCRFDLQQFYHACWEGNPKWMLRKTEIHGRLREVRREWARGIDKCQEYSNVLVDSEPKRFS